MDGRNDVDGSVWQLSTDLYQHERLATEHGDFQVSQQGLLSNGNAIFHEYAIDGNQIHGENLNSLSYALGPSWIFGVDRTFSKPGMWTLDGQYSSPGGSAVLSGGAAIDLTTSSACIGSFFHAADEVCSIIVPEPIDWAKGCLGISTSMMFSRTTRTSQGTTSIAATISPVSS
jgi:hypothetical protein